MGKSIHPEIERYLESVLPRDQFFNKRNLGVLNRRYHPLVCTLAVIINFLGPEVVRVRADEKGDCGVFPVDSVISKVFLLAVLLKDFEFLKQLTTALEKISDFDVLFEKASDIQMDLLTACEDVLNQNKEFTFSNVWDMLMEEPFNWSCKFNDRGSESIRAQAHTELKRMDIRFDRKPST